MEAQLSGFLEKLGLTEYEAKTLTAMFKLSESEVPEISRMAQVPKTRVYDVLEALSQKGLIMEIYGRPKKYKVMEAGAAFDSLINSRKLEVKELEKTAAELRKSLDSNNGKIEDIGKEKVMKVKDKNDFLRILAQEIEGAEKQVIGLTALTQGQDIIKESLKKAKQKNIDIKLIGKASNATKKMLKEYNEMGINVKDYEHGLNAFIIDGKKIVLALTDFAEQKPEYHFTIWKEHPAMVKALQSYFNECWKQGKNL